MREDHNDYHIRKDFSGCHLYKDGEHLREATSFEEHFWRRRNEARAELETARAALHQLKAVATAIKMLQDAVGPTYGLSPEDVLDACNKGLNHEKE